MPAPLALAAARVRAGAALRPGSPDGRDGPWRGPRQRLGRAAASRDARIAVGEDVEPGADIQPAAPGLPRCESMRISHEAIYRARYVQGRGALPRQLAACLRSGRSLRVPRARAGSPGKGFITEQIMISERSTEAEDRAVSGHWEGDL